MVKEIEFEGFVSEIDWHSIRPGCTGYAQAKEISVYIKSIIKQDEIEGMLGKNAKINIKLI